METAAELFPAFLSCIERKDFREALIFCAEIELAMEEDGDSATHNAQLKMNFFCVYMAAFLITGDLDGARYLWRRLPEDFKTDQTEIFKVWCIGKCLWVQDFVLLKSSFEITWSANIQPTIMCLRDAIYQRHLIQISEAYSNMALICICEILMISKEEGIRVCEAMNWEIDSTSGFVKVSKIEVDVGPAGLRTYEKDMDMLQQLSSYVSHLEKKSLKIDTNEKPSAAKKTNNL